MKIDIVYTWVNGNDPIWQAKREENIHGKVSLEALNTARYYDNEELKYSLRSLEKYASWINHVFIVTDGQTPPWLNLCNSQLSIIDHTDIIPHEYLPVFNSVVIEWFIDCISGLSENYIYANDDVFFGRPAKKSDFFNADGNPIILIRNYEEKEGSLYEKHIKNSFDVFFKRTGKKIDPFHPSHVIDPYRKSHVKNVKALFDADLQATYRSRFRSENDIQRVLISAYDHHVGRNHLKHGNPRNLLEKIYKKRLFRTVALNARLEKNFKKVFDERPLMFCLNDQEDTTDDMRIASQKFCEKYFPEKSSFEL